MRELKVTVYFVCESSFFLRKSFGIRKLLVSTTPTYRVGKIYSQSGAISFIWLGGITVLLENEDICVEGLKELESELAEERSFGESRSKLLKEGEDFLRYFEERFNQIREVYLKESIS